MDCSAAVPSGPQAAASPKGYPACGLWRPEAPRQRKPWGALGILVGATVAGAVATTAAPVLAIAAAGE